MTRIAIDSRAFHDGTGRYVERLLHHLQGLDETSEYVVLLMKKDLDRWRPRSPNFRKQAADYPPYGFREQLQFAFKLYRLRADLTHFTMPQHPLLYLKPRIVTIHDLTMMDFINRRRDNPLKDFYRGSVKPVVFRMFLRLALSSATHLVVPTETVKQQLVQRLKVQPHKITVTSYAADRISDPVQAIDRLMGKRFILYVGNAHPHKNLRRLVQAFSLLSDPHLHLVLTGKRDASYQELDDYVARKRIANVEFTGFVSDGQLAWLYGNAALYVFPSLSEGFGLPGLEAMSAGLPVAASNIATLKEVYGQAAAYFDPVDTQEMAQTIEELLRDERRRRLLSALGKKQVQRFSWARMAQQTLDVYKRVTASR